MFYLHKLTNPILWTRTSEALYQTICHHIDKQARLLEVGSGTGHISYMLAKRGNHMTLNDIRNECLVVSRQVFTKHQLPCQVIPGSLFDIKKEFDFVWNSGLIQCVEGKTRKTMIAKLAQLAPRVLLFYPDTESSSKINGANPSKIPGVDDATEYPIGDIPELMNKYFTKVSLGELSAKIIGLPYKMYFVYGENK